MNVSKVVRAEALWHGGIVYADLHRLRASFAPTSVGLELRNLPPVEGIAECSEFLGGLHAWCNQTIAKAKLRVDLLRIEELCCLDHFCAGDVRAFEFTVRTRGIGYWGIGQYQTGEIYRKASGCQIRISIDPRWITGDHAHIMLSSGICKLCGIIAIETVDMQNRIVTGVPIVLAQTITDFTWEVAPDQPMLLCIPVSRQAKSA